MTDDLDVEWQRWADHYAQLERTEAEALVYEDWFHRIAAEVDPDRVLDVPELLAAMRAYVGEQVWLDWSRKAWNLDA